MRQKIRCCLARWLLDFLPNTSASFEQLGSDTMIKHSLPKCLPKCLPALLLLLAFGVSDALAQAPVTFTRASTNESAVSQVEFGFNNLSETAVEVDPAGAGTALFQNNDLSFGVRSLDLFLSTSGPITSIGEAVAGSTLNVGDTFAITRAIGETTPLDVASFINPGENFFVGFSYGSVANGTAGVGYFNVARELVSDDIIYSNGIVTTNPDISILVPAPVPEPSALSLVLLGCVAPLVRRRRTA